METSGKEEKTEWKIEEEKGLLVVQLRVRPGGQHRYEYILKIQT